MYLCMSYIQKTKHDINKVAKHFLIYKIINKRVCMHVPTAMDV